VPRTAALIGACGSTTEAVPDEQEMDVATRDAEVYGENGRSQALDDYSKAQAGN
jgi:hypothetical protein